MSHHPKLTGRQVRTFAKVFSLVDKANERNRKGLAINPDALLQVLNTLTDVSIEILAIDDIDRIEAVRRAIELKESTRT